jgi:hypothetical protein
VISLIGAEPISLVDSGHQTLPETLILPVSVTYRLDLLSDNKTPSQSELRLQTALAVILNQVDTTIGRTVACLATVLRWRYDERTIDNVPTEQVKSEVIATLKAAGLPFNAYVAQTNVWSSAFKQVPVLTRCLRLDVDTGKRCWFVEVCK